MYNVYSHWLQLFCFLHYVFFLGVFLPHIRPPWCTPCLHREFFAFSLHTDTLDEISASLNSNQMKLPQFWYCDTIRVKYISIFCNNNLYIYSLTWFLLHYASTLTASTFVEWDKWIEVATCQVSPCKLLWCICGDKAWLRAALYKNSCKDDLQKAQNKLLQADLTWWGHTRINEARTM